VLLAVLAVLGWLGSRQARASDEPVGLFTTLPIMWRESGDIAAELNAQAPAHWARGVLAERGTIAPLDTLAGPQGHAPLRNIRRLVIAQPRILSPAENVALDDWVRAGGHLLLLADPALTEESSYALGDPRRPQTVALLSPILTRWGIELRFDEAQAFGEGEGEVMGQAVPVNLPGHFATRGQDNCRLWGNGLVVTCAIGRGRVVALADAAVLEAEDPDGRRARAFAGLLDTAFAAR
jgi:hypothetical protein